MLPIEKYIDAIENKDYEGLGNLFTRDGHYCDYCANGTPQHDYHLYGKEAISMFFRNKFLCRQYSILEPTVLSPSQAEFIAWFWRISCDGHCDTAAVIRGWTYPQVNRTAKIKRGCLKASPHGLYQVPISFFRCLRTTLKCFFNAFAPAASSRAASAS